MSDSKKWKDKLLSAGLPLEYEASRAIARFNFQVDVDYAYFRESKEGIRKEFSVDIHGYGSAPFADDSKITVETIILAECKYRRRGKVWLFTRPPPEGAQLVIVGRSIRIYDEMTPYLLPKRPFFEFDDRMPRSIKGVQIDLHRGDVHGNTIRHGISQLRYALPRVLSNRLQLNATGHPEDNVPVALLPILVTSAPLYIAPPDFSIASVEQASEIADVGTRVPYLIVEAAGGPDIGRHSRRAFHDLSGLADSRPFKQAQELREAAEDVKEWSTPNTTLRNLENGDSMELDSLVSDFIVCNSDSIEQLLGQACGLIEEVGNSAVDLRDNRSKENGV